MKVVAAEDGRLRAIGKRITRRRQRRSRSACSRSASGGAEQFREAIERAMRTTEGTTIWYLRVIHHLAQSGEVWTLDIKGEEWGEVDFPPDVEAARELTARWDARKKARGGLADARAQARHSGWWRAGIGPFASAGRCEGAISVRAWRRRRDDSSKHGDECARPRRARHCNASLSIPVHGEGWRATRSAAGRARDGALAVAAAAEIAPELRRFRRRQVLRRPDDIAGASTRAAIRGAGLAFLGFPLHPAGAPAIDRADHLSQVQIPMLFVSGDRDALAEVELLRTVVGSLGERATLHLVKHADHGLRVPVKSGRTPTEVQAEALDAMAEWMIGLN